MLGTTRIKAPAQYTLLFTAMETLIAGARRGVSAGRVWRRISFPGGWLVRSEKCAPSDIDIDRMMSAQIHDSRYQQTVEKAADKVIG